MVFQLHPRMAAYFRRLQAVDFRHNTVPAGFRLEAVGQVSGFCSPTDFSWLYLEEGRVLVVRPVMLEACDAVEAMRRCGEKVAVITGSPGTGKTALSNVLVSDWLRDDNVFEIVIHNAAEAGAWHIRKHVARGARAGQQKRKRSGPPAAAAVSSYATARSSEAAKARSAGFVAEHNYFEVYHVPRGQVLIELEKITARYTTEQLNSVVYLFDAATATGQPEKTSIFTVVTASPAENHFLDVKKRAGSTVPFYLPLWSLEHLQAAADLTYSILRTTRIDVESNYQEFNGVWHALATALYHHTNALQECFVTV